MWRRPPLESHRTRTASIATPSGPTSHQRIGGRGAAGGGTVGGRGCWEGKELTGGGGPARDSPDHVAGRPVRAPGRLRTAGGLGAGVVPAVTHEMPDEPCLSSTGSCAAFFLRASPPP